jgi:dienelactone hydrolase
MNETPIAYRDGDTALTGFLVSDDPRPGTRPGVLVVHGGAGLDAHARDRARRLAGLGYTAFACDMYGDGIAGDRTRVMARIGELMQDPARLRQRAAAGLAVLKANADPEKVAAVGYCFGGMTVLELARSGVALAGVVSVHGTLKTTQPAAVSTVRAKVLVCHGALDPHVPMTQVTAFGEEMTAAGVDWQLIMYGGARHGFTHAGEDYNAVADARSSAAIESFLSEVHATTTSEEVNNR